MWRILLILGDELIFYEWYDTINAAEEFLLNLYENHKIIWKVHSSNNQIGYSLADDGVLILLGWYPDTEALEMIEREKNENYTLFRI